MLVFGLVDAALRFGFFDPERKTWWRTILIASLLTGAACLINPYFITGALYPLELAGTMSNPIFSQKHRRADHDSGVPPHIEWRGSVEPADPASFRDHDPGRSQLSCSLRMGDRRLACTRPATRETRSDVGSGDSSDNARRRRKTPGQRQRGPKRPGTSRRRRPPVNAPPAGDSARSGSCSIRRLPRLSFQATRNSHQFAAVVGTITAWNFGEWAACVRAAPAGSRNGRGASLRAPAPVSSPSPRLAWFSLWVGSGALLQDDRRGARDRPG